MALSSGNRFGPYEIISAIGCGGMGEVYRARDTKLNRDVAVKVLPDMFAHDAERVARFTREAQTLAALNHPNIAQIYGIVDAPAPANADAGAAHVHALVMELVEGDDLSSLIASGALPLAEAMPIARQIAEALETAHEQGIVHRDLKPANIKVREDGTVKVLDFGLAKALSPEAASATADAMNSPTLTARATQMGMIIGTAAYMAPEQARGKSVDKRADIWAFGVVLYEMLTGLRAFNGKEIPDVLAAVLRQDIEWTALPAGTPARLRRLLERCLDRDLKQRLRDIGEARIALSAPDALETAGASPTTTPPHRSRTTRPRLAIALGCVVAGAALGVFVGPTWRDAPGNGSERSLRTIALPAPGRTLDDSQAISPDGRFVAYTAGNALWIRNLGELEAREVPGSRGARGPFWSPRSDAVAFGAGNALFKVSRDGGKAVELCRIASGEFTGGSWSASKGIVFTAGHGRWVGDVLRVPEEGGEPEIFTRPDAAKGERRISEPHFLPDGRSLFYTVVAIGTNEGEIVLDRNGTRTILGLGTGSSQAVWSPTGHVVFTRLTGAGHSLWALPYSLDNLAAAGEAFRVAVLGTGASAAADGTIVYGRLVADPHQLVWVDRTGRLLGAVGEPLRSTIWGPAISPDGHRVAAVVKSQAISVWDTDRGVETRTTAESELTDFPEWSRAGNEIAYSLLSGAEGLRARRADGAGDARTLLQRATALAPSFSRDGRIVAYYVVDPQMGRDLWAFNVGSMGEPFPLLRTKANEALPRISPDGRFVAYQSDTSGRWEVYVQPFPRGDGRWQVSVGGGQHPLWNPRGGELFYVSGNVLMAVQVTVLPAFRVSPPQRLFGGLDVRTNLSDPTLMPRFYDVTPDGRRFIVVQGNGMGSSDVVLMDGAWMRATTERRR